MADEQAQEQGAANQETKKSSGMKVALIFLIITLLLLGGGAFATKHMWMPEEEEERLKPPSFVVLEPFIITLKSESRPHYLQIKLSLMSRDETVTEKLETYRPMIRNEMINYLSRWTFEEVSVSEAPVTLKKESLLLVTQLLEREMVEVDIEELIITDFIIQ